MTINSGWSDERRQRQAELIRSWAPWTKSTGPRTENGKASSSQNAWKGGVRQTLKRIRLVLALQAQELDGVTDLLNLCAGPFGAQLPEN